MASTSGQNVHLVLPHNHVVVSSSHLANSLSQLVLSSSLSQSVVELSRRVVESSRRVVKSSRRLVFFDLVGKLRTTTKFTTTTSVDWERTGTRTSVSAGKRKLKMQSIGRSTTTILNENKHVEVVRL